MKLDAKIKEALSIRVHPVELEVPRQIEAIKILFREEYKRERRKEIRKIVRECTDDFGTTDFDMLAKKILEL